MKQFKKFFFALTLISAVLFSACNDISMDESQSDSDGRAYISVSVKDFARLISPTNTEEKDIVLVNLYSKESGATGEAELVKEWEASESKNAITVMSEDDPILFETGTYDFTLKLYVNNKYASGSVVSQKATITKEIKAGQNELVFNTKYAGETGFVNIKLYWWNGVGIKVDAASAALYAVNDDLSIGDKVENSELSLTITDYDGKSEPTTNFAVTYQSAVAAGDYYIIFKLKRAGTEIYDTWSELIKVVNGAYTEAEKEFEDPNVYFNITYMTPGESESGWVEVADSTNKEATHWNEGVEPVTVRNINTTVPLPTGTQITRPNETKDGQISKFEFDGWYEELDADGNIAGTALTSIGTGDQTVRNFTLYAKWKEKVDMTFSVSIETGDSSDIIVTNNAASLTDTNLVFTVDTSDGEYDTYTWKVDGETQDEASSALTVNMLGKASGVYDVSLLATKTGDDNKTEYYSYLAQIEWTRKYMVDFVTNKDGSEVDSQYFAEGGETNVIEPTDVKPTYGWFTDEECKIPYDFENAGAPTSSFTLYGLWEITEFYVSPDGTDEKELSNLAGYGIESKPLATIAGAVALMNDSTKDYTIYVDGKLTGEQKIQKSNELANGGLAQSITLCGKNGIDSETDLPKDSLNGSDSGRTLTVSSDVPVTISGLLITGGYGDTNTWGGGLSVSNGSEVTLSKDAYIQENTASRGGGINVDGTLIMLDGSVISDNKSTEDYGGGVYVGSGGVLDMRGGEISGNGFTVTSDDNQGAGVYVCGTSGTIKLSGSAQINKNNAVHLSAYTHLTISGALTGDSPVVTIEPVGYSTTTQWIVLEEGADTTLAAEYGKIAVTPDGSDNWRITEEGYLQQLADIDGVVSQINNMTTESGTISVSGYMVQDDLVTIVNAMKAKCPEYSSVAPDIMIKLDLSNTTGLTKLSGEFSETWNLGELVLPEGITTISAVGERTDYLATMNIPASVTKIDDGAFYRSCASLTIAEGNTSYKIVNKALYTADLTRLVAYANKNDDNGSCEVLASATEIAPWAFSFAKKLKTLTFATSSSLQKIGQEAFDYCDALEDIVLPESVTELGTGVFQYAHVTSMSLPSGLTEIPSSTFSNNDFTRIVIPDGVTTIAGSAFWACSELDSIVLPASVKTIGDNAFKYCDSLATVYYKGSETDKAGITIGSGNDALDGATWIYESDGPIVLNKGSTVNATIKKFHDQLVNSDVASISFAKSTTMPSAGTEIAYLDEKEEVPVWADGSAIYYYKDDDSTIFLNEDSSKMFFNLDKFASIDLSGFDTSRVQNMSSMFSSCSDLSALNMEGFDTRKVTDMSYMFSYCSALESLDVSTFVTSKVTNMSGMFMYCSSLTALNVSKFDTALVTDMSYMFAGCSGLNTLEVANFTTYNVTTMRAMFSSCSSLTLLDLQNFLTDSVTNMNSMFSSCSDLTSIDLSIFDTSKVEDMEEMFSGCSSLASIDLDNFVTSSVTTVSNMFYECTALVSIDLSKFDMSSIDPDYSLTETFSGCTALASVKLPSAIQIIGDYAFYKCTSLTSILIPVSVTTIGTNAFSDSGLTTVNYPGTEAQKNEITIASSGGVDKLNSATWVCNYGN